jgi:hypothetical protein
MRKNDLSVRGVLMAAACVAAIIGVTVMRFSEAQGRSTQLASLQPSGSIPATAVPADLRRALAGTCEGYNLELEHAAGTALRAGNGTEANRLMGMRQACNGATPAGYLSR